MDVPDLLLGQHPPGLQGFPLRLLCRDVRRCQFPTELMGTREGEGSGLWGPVT